MEAAKTGGNIGVFVQLAKKSLQKRGLSRKMISCLTWMKPHMSICSNPHWMTGLGHGPGRTVMSSMAVSPW